MKPSLTPIGTFHSCFKEKFGIPRQAGIIKENTGYIELSPSFNRDEWVRGLTTYSHIWLVFLFHKNLGRNIHSLVRPPRLGGNMKLGVFASRSGFRPNFIGLSAVELKEIQIAKKCIRIMVKGADILDQTPILDIKPYLPYADAISHATAPIAPDAPKPIFRVCFSKEADEFLSGINEKDYPEFRRIIKEVLSRDHRPAYYKKMPLKKNFGMVFYDFEIKWIIEDDEIMVTTISLLKTKPKGVSEDSYVHGSL